VAKKGKILFDSGHDEDHLELLVERLTKDGFVCDSYKELISTPALEPYTALFLAYPRKDFEEEEKEAMIEFSKQGGCVAITANLQSQKEYETFVENKGDLVRALLNTELNYRQLLPRFSFDTKKYEWIGRLPRKPGLEISDIGIPYSEIAVCEISVKHPLFENIKKIFEGKKVGVGYFYPVDEEKVLLEQWVQIPSYVSDDELGFRQLNRQERDSIDRLFSEESNRLMNTCVGLLNQMSEGIGKNTGFTANIFNNEQIEQDKEKNANFRLIADLLRLGSEARLYVIPAEELKPERKEPPIPAAPPIRIKLPDILTEIKEDAERLQKMVGDRYVAYKAVKQIREDLIDKLAEAKLYRESYFKIFIKMPEEVDPHVPEHRTLEESDYDSYRALYQSALSDLLSDIGRREKEAKKIQEKILRFEQ